MKHNRYLLGFILLVAGALPTFAQFSGTVSDSQGVQYTANDDESTCRVSGHESNLSATIVIPEVYEDRRVTSIGDWAFINCNNLTSVTIPSSVTSIGHNAFSRCSGLTSVTIPEGVTSIGDMAFSGCSGLMSLTIPEGVTSIGSHAFIDCSGLTSIIVEDGNTVYDSRDNCNAIIRTADNTLIAGCMNTIIPSSVTSIDSDAFYGCSGLTSVTIPSGVTSIADGVFCGCSGLTSLTIPSGVTSIGSEAFYSCSGLTSVTIPSSVTSIGRSAFGNCSSLASLTIPSSVTSIGDWALIGCSGLTSIIVGEGNTVYDSRDNCNAIIRTDENTLIAGCKNTVIPSSVTSIGDRAFYNCSSLTSVTIPSSVTSIDDWAFNGCSGLTSLMILEGMKSIGYGAFRGCSCLTSVTIPSSVTSIGGDAFEGCSSLTSVTIPSSVTSIGGYVFSDCSGLTSIIVEDGNTVYDSRDNCNAIIRTDDNTLIAGCMNTVIPSSVTSILYGAFTDCSTLTSLTIPESVTSVGSVSFWGCSGLTSVVVGWETPIEINDHVFNNSNYNNATLYVPKGTKAAYEAADVWKDFGKIVEYDLPQENVELTDVSAIDNVIYMDPIEVTKGKEVTVSLKMKNSADIRGFQFDMQLPFGVTVKKDENDRFVSSLNDKRLPSGSAHTLTVSEQQDGTIRFLCGSQQDETFTGADGEILTVRLCIDEHMLDGQYPVVLKNVKLTETNINNYYETATVQTAMTIIAYTPGDISGDGAIDVSDYIGVANYIMGNTPAGFVAAAADVNKDQKVDVSDYIGIANMILYNNIYGKTVNESRGMGRRRANTDVSTLDNAIYISPFSVLSNDEAQVSIRMKNTVGIRGFQFDLYLPEGMTAVKDGNNRFVSSLSNGRKPAGDQHTLTLSEQQNGAIRFLCGSQYDETFTGTDGEIATLTINIDASVAVGDYPVYLRNMKLTETDISKFYTTEEVETTVTVTGAADGRVVLDETSTTAPEDANGVDVRVKRTINAGEWSTICLPFAMSQAQCQAAFGSDVEIGDFTGYTYNSGEDRLTVNFSSVTAIAANHPYIIKVSAAVTEFTVDGVDVNPADDPRVSFRASNKKLKDFVGTYVADFDFYDEAKHTPLFLSGNQFWYATEATKHLKAYRAYFDFVDMLSEVDAARIAISFGDATAIKDVRMCSDDRYYNLSGQQVKAPAKGVFVKNGKKIIVK